METSEPSSSSALTEFHDSMEKLMEDLMRDSLSHNLKLTSQIPLNMTVLYSYYLLQSPRSIKLLKP